MAAWKLSEGRALSSRLLGSSPPELTSFIAINYIARTRVHCSFSDFRHDDTTVYKSINLSPVTLDERLLSTLRNSSFNENISKNY